MKSYAKITYSCNEPPEIRDESDAIKMRLRVTEFPFTFAKNPQPGQRLAKDRRALMDEFRSEIPGIINWSLEGLNRFLSNGCQFSASRSTEEVWKFYKRRSKPVVCFIEECLERTEDDGDYIFPEEAYKFFEGWLKTKGIKLAVTRAKFFRDMRNEGIEPNQSKQLRMKRAYFGVRLLHGNAVTPSVCSLVVANEVVVEREGSSEARYRVTDTDPHLEELFKVLADLDRQHPNGIPRTELWKGLLTYTKANDLPEDYAKSALEFWKEDGIIFCPSEGLVKKT
jgi:phage/plasmid-associated DNA primase